MNEESENSGMSKSATGLKEHVSADAESFLQRFREALTKPVTLTIAGLVFIATITLEYGFSRLMDEVWGVEPPEEMVALQSELQSSSEELRKATSDIETLIGLVDHEKVDDPELRDQLAELDNKLRGLTDLAEITSSQTSKVAVISEALRDDWLRLQQQTKQDTDSVPDLVIRTGEGIQLCRGLSAVGVHRITQSWVEVNHGSTKARIAPGGRMNVAEDAWIDYLGPRDNIAKFKVHCPD